MTSPAAPFRLTPASIGPARPVAPSVTNTTAIASSLSSTDEDVQSSGPPRRRRPLSLFSSLLSGSTAAKPRTAVSASSTPSIAASSVSVFVTRQHRHHHNHHQHDHYYYYHHHYHCRIRHLGQDFPELVLPHRHIRSPNGSSSPNHNPAAASTNLSTHRALRITTTAPAPQAEQVAQARTAVLASIGNLLDRELATRAAQLHANGAAIERQEREVERATAALRRENDRLGRLAETHARRVKEVGDVQNWAEMLERDFLILEETLRLVNDNNNEEATEGSETGSESGDGSEGGSRSNGPETVPLPASPPFG
ncbi:hypothetical protein MYCTH_2113390 [Thermothelomyces thermophilus ATCC 42464]|uniref:Biogenesis of lysosome-related organelles complex 1 subunit 1 n=1 Tax=Thermothelomyces thermophilus (strain ATCC 42464 / BCRC 31852 / DSM 1799) TaxID=573729 RepID=G2QPG4_THET4|nr:uncharacterized protein MYCTH_2113390 [Thermothelomyces thermophilus ATCC 42464]AEO61477.1 hypothetical protein MYCTH_2113390 [Thermothelomyces thermophilus ATCC 42464]